MGQNLLEHSLQTPHLGTGKSRGARARTHTRVHTDACTSPHVALWIL